VAWSIPGFIWLSAATWFARSGQRIDLLSFAWTIFLNWTLVGAISGAVFAVTLSIAERRKQSLEALSMRRVAVWGAVAGAGLPLLLIPIFSTVPNVLSQVAVVVGLNGILGAGSAAASLSVARRADVAAGAGRLTSR
jgi:hypothetical protein